MIAALRAERVTGGSGRAPSSLPRLSRSPTGDRGLDGACACGGGCPRCAAGGAFMPKLEVSQPGDPLEREADSAAAAVMAGSGFTRNPTSTREPGLQRCGSVPSVSCPCHDAPPVVGEVLRSPGETLDAETRSLMESRFGRDFGDVRVHADELAAESARSVNALAYTVGRDIVFDAGQYAPGTDSGRRVLAHELTHVVQQDGSSMGLAEPRVGPTDDQWEHEADATAAAVSRTGARAAVKPGRKAPAGVLRRLPGQDAPDSWAALVRPAFPKDREQKQRAEEAIRRLLWLRSGSWLINALYALFCKAGKCGTRVNVSFVDQLPRGSTDASGLFEPEWAGQPLYDVWVKNVAPHTGPGIELGGAWPGGTSIDIPFTYTDAESHMAETLYHELLHVWFVNTQQGSPYTTGHRDVMKGEIDPVFYKAIRGFIGELNDLEKRIHNEAKQREQTVQPPTPPSRSLLDVPEAPRRAPEGPSLVGGEVSIHGGAAGVRGAAAGAGILGADLVLNQIYSLRLGARGVYLTPDNLLVGGSLGLRILQEGQPGRRVENPLFFDLEAGILAEVTPQEANRLTNNVAGLGAAGIGQEFGTQGPRFFWRLGGFVIISDRKELSGGGTAGVGVRF